VRYKDVPPSVTLHVGADIENRSTMLSLLIIASAASALAQPDAIPQGFNTSQWSWVSNEDPILAVIPGTFNRTVFDAPSAANVSDQRVNTM
jgi:hypothetical protein